jgi:N-formylglutamate deformylase
MPQNLILHIPHSSNHLPNRKGFTVDQAVLEHEILKLTDWYTDDLFSFPGSIAIKAEFSRIFCDPERFSDDNQEVMAKFGMGVLYEKGDDGSIIREVDQTLRNEILNTYYWPHHERLNQAVKEQLEEHGKAMIVDCHSFPSKPFIRDLDQSTNRPDFNIGTDPFHTPKELIELSKDFFQQKGFSLGIDWPYSGSLVPMSHYHRTKEVQSIMLEVNRALYLDEPSNDKSGGYADTKETVREYLALIRKKQK